MQFKFWFGIIIFHNFCRNLRVFERLEVPLIAHSHSDLKAYIGSSEGPLFLSRNAFDSVFLSL